MIVHSILWRRIEFPGYETCRLFFLDSYWQLEGTAVFSHNLKPCYLIYQIICDTTWHTLSAHVEGCLGNKKISLQHRTEPIQHWWLNEVEAPGVIGYIDLDLNLSPSTNLIPIRMLNLSIGEKADISAAWLKFPSFTLESLPQQYHRLEERIYRYESSGGSFVADL